MAELANQVALVTGAGSGFGCGIAEAFAAAGARVAVVDVDADAAETTAKRIDGLALTTDITDPVAVKQAVQSVIAEWGTLDILVNNAGMGLSPSPLEAVNAAEFARLNDVNLGGIFHFSQAVVPVWKQNNRGCMLNIASTAGVSPRPGLTWYNASKGWVITATRSMALELAPYNIRVNALNPVAGETPMLATFMGEDTPETRAAFLNTIPLGRFSTPQDLGAAAVFLCSDAASLITGVCLEIDGGRCI